MILRRVHFLGPNRPFNARQKAPLRRMQSDRIYVNQSMQGECECPDCGMPCCDRTHRRGADFRPRRTPADAANRASRRPNSVRNYVDNASYLGSTGFSDVFG